MFRYRLIAGILLLVAAALMFLALDSDLKVPIGAVLAVAGIALVGTSMRRAR